MISPLISAFRILTIIPVPGKDTSNFSKSLLFFPIVGAFLGAVVYAFHYLMSLLPFEQWSVFSLISLVIITILTGGLHLDGLADVADAFGGGKDRNHIFSILKDSRVGTFGVLALIFDIIIKWQLWVVYFSTDQLNVIICSLVLSRVFQALFLITFPNARNNGIASAFYNESTLLKCCVVLACIASVIFLYLLVQAHIIIFISILVPIGALFGFLCIHKIKGVTGDCVGTLNEITELSVLISGLFFF